MKILAKNIALIFFLASINLSVFAWGTLQKHEVDGFDRYCYYSDGGISTVSSSSLCSNTNSEQNSNSNSPVINKQKSTGGWGTLQSHSSKGFNRYCNYSNGAVLTVGSSELCPITSN